MATDFLSSGKRYRSLDYELKRIYGNKVVKFSVNAGFSCPNRQNGSGCIFCTEQGSGEFSGIPTAPNASITEQISFQKQFISQKWNTDLFFAYFQSYSNTYAPVSVLKTKYDEALSAGALGLAIATRPDCLSNEVLDLLQSYSCPLWLELGLQSITCHDKLNRGYSNDIFSQAASALLSRNIPFVTHVIFSLPWESPEQSLETVRFAVNNGTSGIKLHMLYIDKTAPLYNLYKTSPFPMLSRAEYIDLVTEAIAYLPENVVVHRLTGDGAHNTLVAPLWTKNKRSVLNGIDKALKEKNYIQGCKL